MPRQGMIGSGGGEVTAPTMIMNRLKQYKRQLWRCPKCGHRFVGRNMWHSCGRHRLAGHFRGQSAALRQTFAAFVAAARTCGPVTVYAQQTRIVLQGRVRFAGAVVHRQWLDVGLWLRRRAGHPLLTRIESFGRLGYGHHFRLRTAADVDKALVRLMREAYVVGQQD